MYDRPTSRKMIMPGKRSISNRVQYHDIISNLDLILSTLDNGNILIIWNTYEYFLFPVINLINSLKLNIVELVSRKNVSFKFMKIHEL